jgi:DNA-binding NtrC family response regulator
MPNPGSGVNKPDVYAVDYYAQFIIASADVLMAHGYKTLALGDARATVKPLRRHSPPVAVIDLTLPDAFGLKLAREIKEASPEAECIVLTGYASQESPMAAVSLGAYSCVQKPFDLDQCLLTIRSARQQGGARAGPAGIRGQHSADPCVAATDHQLPQKVTQHEQPAP